MTGLSDSIKGAAKGHVLIRGPWAGLMVHPEKEFSPVRSLRIPGENNFLNIFLQTIMAKIVNSSWLLRQCVLLMQAQIGGITRRCSPSGIWQHWLKTPNHIFPISSQKVVVGEHFVLKDLLFYAVAREADAQARQECLSHREERRQEGTLRRAPGEKRSALLQLARPPTEKKRKVAIKGIVIRSSIPSSSSTSTSESSLPRHVPDAKGSRPSVPTNEHLALSVGKESKVDQPVPPCSEPEDDQLAIAVKLVVKEPRPFATEPAPPTLIVIDETTAERMESPCRELDHLAIVVVDKPIARRPIVSHDLQASFD